MNFHKTLSAVAVAAVASALTLVASGVARADTCGYIAGSQAEITCPDVSWDSPSGVGLTVHVTNPFIGTPLDCTYTSNPNPEKNPLALPPYQYQFHLPGADLVDTALGQYSWPITSATGLPAMATGTEWLVAVDCEGYATWVDAPLATSRTTTKVF